MNYVYLLRCADGTLYCGWTTDLAARLEAHNSGNGAKYTRSRRPVVLVYHEEYDDRHEARSRECRIKRLSRQEKLALIRSASGIGGGQLPDANLKDGEKRCRRKSGICIRSGGN